MNNENPGDFIMKICEFGEVYIVGGAVRNYLYNCFHGTLTNR
jgi:tRNA nucleotidyltransferase/poly(A) polymerase